MCTDTNRKLLEEEVGAEATEYLKAKDAIFWGNNPRSIEELVGRTNEDIDQAFIEMSKAMMEFTKIGVESGMNNLEEMENAEGIVSLPITGITLSPLARQLMCLDLAKSTIVFSMAAAMAGFQKYIYKDIAKYLFERPEVFSDEVLIRLKAKITSDEMEAISSLEMSGPLGDMLQKLKGMVR